MLFRLACADSSSLPRRELREDFTPALRFVEVLSGRILEARWGVRSNCGFAISGYTPTNPPAKSGIHDVRTRDDLIVRGRLVPFAAVVRSRAAARHPARPLQFTTKPRGQVMTRYPSRRAAPSPSPSEPVRARPRCLTELSG
jgi:hypothetical protein